MKSPSAIKSTEQQYADLMHEAKVRLSSIETVFKSKIGLRAIVVQDFGYIQLRMLCELIALACVVAHGDLVKTRAANLREEWKVGKIIKALDGIHPDFFPRAITQERVRPGYFKFTARPKTESMSKSELKRLYNICGDRGLHRGHVGNLDKFTKKSLTENFREISSWASRISELLGIHVISLLDGQTKYVCVLKSPPDDGVSFSRIEKLGQS
jgi:hypothetical protein